MEGGGAGRRERLEGLEGLEGLKGARKTLAGGLARGKKCGGMEGL